MHNIQLEHSAKHRDESRKHEMDEEKSHFKPRFYEAFISCWNCITFNLNRI